jgi:hypothetical protein
MHTGSELVETWIPVGGFKIERRKIRTPEGNTTFTDCLVPKWEPAELAADRPCARQPCLHRIVADRAPERAPILDLAGRYGLLTAATTPTGALQPEPLDIWRNEIRELRAATDLWERIAAGDPRANEPLTRRLALNLARFPFHMDASHENGASFRLRYRPPNLRAALWQRFAGEIAGIIRCARCPAPDCGRWLLKGDDSRSDRKFCSAACRIRAFRRTQRIG